MKRVVLFLLLVAGATLVPVLPSSASWVSTHCSNNTYVPAIWRRMDARAYAEVAFKEGYEYAGGCWNNNNVDDTPNQPDSDGEGPDCSGLVFKSWALKNSWGNYGFQYWDALMNVHGPYSSYAFHDVGTQSDLPFHRLGTKSNAQYMDAFARDGHVGMLYSAVKTANGTYRFAEAKGDQSGTGVFEETWMGDSDYVAVERKGWTADCYPSCQRSAISGGEVVKVEA